MWSADDRDLEEKYASAFTVLTLLLIICSAMASSVFIFDGFFFEYATGGGWGGRA